MTKPPGAAALIRLSDAENLSVRDICSIADMLLHLGRLKPAARLLQKASRRFADSPDLQVRMLRHSLATGTVQAEEAAADARALFDASRMVDTALHAAVIIAMSEQADANVIREQLFEWACDARRADVVLDYCRATGMDPAMAITAARDISHNALVFRLSCFDPAAIPPKSGKAIVRTLLEQKEADLALAWAETLYGRFPDDPWMSGLLLRSAAMRDEVSETALGVASALLSDTDRLAQWPRDLAFRAALLILKFAPDKGDLALERFRAVCQSASDRTQLARLLMRRQAYAEAIDLLSDDLGEHDEALRLCGLLLLRSGRWDRNLPALRRYAGLFDLSDEHRADTDAVMRALDLAEKSEERAIRARSRTSPALPMSLAVMRGEQLRDSSFDGPAVMIGGSLAMGGAERINAMVFSELRKRHGPDVEFWIRRTSDPADLFFLPLTGVGPEEIVSIPDAAAKLGAPSLDPPAEILRALSTSLRLQSINLYALFREVRPRAVYASLDFAMLSTGIAGVLAGVPQIVLHSHNMRPVNSISSAAQCFGWADSYDALFSLPHVRFVSVSDAARLDYFDWIDTDRTAAQSDLSEVADRSLTIHNGFDFSPFDRPDLRHAAEEVRKGLGIPLDVPLIGTAFRFAAVKRPERWVDMAMIIAREISDCHFVMYGDGELRAAEMARVAQAGLAGRFHFPGIVSDMPSAMTAMDVFALSSSSEGLPNTLIEAQSVGTPVAAYDVGGVRETMLPGKTGVAVADDTAEALAAAIIGIVQDTAWREAASARARLFVRDRFSLERMVNSIESLLFQV